MTALRVAGRTLLESGRFALRKGEISAVRTNKGVQRGVARVNYPRARTRFRATTVCNYSVDVLFGMDALLNVVHAAAENTSTLATMTGDALISTP
jgi:hypothetical protein